MAKLYILKEEKISSPKSLAKRAVHNFRQIPNAVINADINRQHLNVVLVNPGREDYLELWKERQYIVNMEGGKCKPRKDSVYAYEIILGYSHGAIPDDKVMDWAQANVKWLGEAFGGKENVLSAVLHMDETTPHIHAIVIPIDERNHLCAKSFTGGRQKMFKLRDSYTEAMKQFGLEAPERYTKADSLGLRRFYRAVNSVLDTKVPEKQEDETIDEYVDRCENWARDVKFKTMDELDKANKRVARLLAKQESYNLDNKQAHHLTNALVIKYCGNKKRAKKIILQFSEFVNAVDINTLERTINFLEEKFIEIENKNLLSIDKSAELVELNEELKD